MNGKNKQLLSGNQAIARGAIESGVGYAASYPGTPATEILLSLIENAKEYNLRCDWATNEKVALETAIGASLAGVRSLVSMKHVGLNVAADPLFSLAYTGVNAGLVVVVCDDPGPWSSQNEQDSRYYAKSTGIPCFEPADPGEAKEMTREAFDLSEESDIPVLIRSTTRVSHSTGIVTLGQVKHTSKELSIPITKYVMIPKHAKIRHKELIAKQEKLQEYSNNSKFNELAIKSKDGIIASGVCYAHTRQLLSELNINNFSLLKLGVTNPLPDTLLQTIITKSDKTLIIEELEPYVEEHALRFGQVFGKKYISRVGEVTPDMILAALNAFFKLNFEIPESKEPEEENPAMCAGCPHRALYYSLNKLDNILVTGDIGCYTLGALPPLSSIKTQMCMGSGINHAVGLYHAKIPQRPVAVIGDSTFIHSGITGLINAVYTSSKITIVVLDNRTTAMTGFQPHPATGVDAMGNAVHELNLEGLCRACGAKYVCVVDPYNLDQTLAALKRCLRVDGVSVLISRRACALKAEKSKPLTITDRCILCKECLRIGCPAIEFVDGRIRINSSCNGCGVCADICKVGAIE